MTTGLSWRPLDETTWSDFARLIEIHNGVWGGCWCMAFHVEGVGRSKTSKQNRIEKECRVREGRAHAALVYDGLVCVAWCQFGSPDELPRIKHRRAYLEGCALFQTGGSLVSSSRANTGIEGSLRSRFRLLCTRLRGLEAERWRAIPRTSELARSRIVSS